MQSLIEVTVGSDGDSESHWEDWEEVYPTIANLILSLDILCSVISIIGCIGNVLTMVIISKWKDISSGAAFMYSLALTDLLAVFYDGILDELLPLFGWTLSSLSDVICALCKYFSWTTTLTSYYVTLLFSLDKCLAVLFPFKYREYGKPKACVIGTLLAYFLLGGWSTQTFFVYRIHPVTETCRPVKFDVITREFFFDIRVQIGNFINGIIPIGGVILFTVITIVKLRFTGLKRSGNVNKPATGGKRDAEITRQMIVVSILFAALCLGFTLCVQAKGRIEVETMADERNSALLNAFQSNFLALTNSVNFFVYLLLGQKFRRDFLYLIRGISISYNTKVAATKSAGDPSRQG